MAEFLRFAEAAAAQDLRVFLERAQHAGAEAVRLVTPVPGVLAVYVGVLYPLLLADAVPTVLGMRAVRLAPAGNATVGAAGDAADAGASADAGAAVGAGASAGAGPAQVDAVVSVRSLLERLARPGVAGLSVPPTEVSAAWAGVLPPQSGWEPVGVLSAESLRAVARDGVARVQQALPVSPGDAVVQRVRARVWGESMLPEEHPFPRVPAGMAFVADALGFLAAGLQQSVQPGAGEQRAPEHLASQHPAQQPQTQQHPAPHSTGFLLSRSRAWVKLATPAGFVFARQ